MRINKGDLVTFNRHVEPKHEYLITESLDFNQVYFKLSGFGIHHSGSGEEKEFNLYTNIFGEEDAI